MAAMTNLRPTSLPSPDDILAEVRTCSETAVEAEGRAAQEKASLPAEWDWSRFDDTARAAYRRMRAFEGMAFGLRAGRLSWLAQMMLCEADLPALAAEVVAAIPDGYVTISSTCSTLNMLAASRRAAGGGPGQAAL